MRGAAAAAFLYAARRYYRNWGTTKESAPSTCPVTSWSIAPWSEQRRRCGSTRRRMRCGRGWCRWARTVAACTATKHWRTCRLDYHNADRIHPEWQRLAPGDRVRLAPRGWMGLRRRFCAHRCRGHRKAGRHAVRGPTGASPGRRLVVPRYSVLGRSLPASGAIPDTAAPLGRRGGHRMRGPGEGAGDSGNASWHQAPR